MSLKADLPTRAEDEEGPSLMDDDGICITQDPMLGEIITK